MCHNVCVEVRGQVLSYFFPPPCEWEMQSQITVLGRKHPLSHITDPGVAWFKITMRTGRILKVTTSQMFAPNCFQNIKENDILSTPTHSLDELTTFNSRNGKNGTKHANQPKTRLTEKPINKTTLLSFMLSWRQQCCANKVPSLSLWGVPTLG